MIELCQVSDIRAGGLPKVRMSCIQLLCVILFRTWHPFFIKKKEKEKEKRSKFQTHNRFDGYRFAIGDKIFITILFFSFLRFHIRCGSAEKIFIIFYYILLLLLFLQTVEIFVSNYNFNFFKNTLFTPASFSISTCKLFNQTPGSFYPRFSKKREFIRNRIDNAPTPRSS